MGTISSELKTKLQKAFEILPPVGSLYFIFDMRLELIQFQVERNQ